MAILFYDKGTFKYSFSDITLKHFEHLWKKNIMIKKKETTKNHIDIFRRFSPVITTYYN